MKKFNLTLLLSILILILCGPVFGDHLVVGDLNNDGKVDLTDAILALKITSCADTGAQTISINNADINFNGKIATEEAIFILQAVAGMREIDSIGKVGPAGGTLQSSDGNVQFVFPPGAVSEETYIFVTVNNTFPADDGVIPGSVFTFGPKGIQFNEPVTVIIQYDPSALPVGVTEANLQLSKIVSDFWAPVTGSAVDTAAHTVTAAITGFSTYAARAPMGPQLSPAVAIVKPGGEIEISIANVTADPYNPKWCRYEVSGAYGKIHTGSSPSPGTVKYGYTGPAHYVANADAGVGTDTLTVEVFDGPNATYPSLGNAKSVIYVGERIISLIPEQTMLQGSQQIEFNAYVTPKLDDTMSLMYQWNNTAAAGDLTNESPGNLNAFRSAKPTAIYTGKDYGNTTDTITVGIIQKGGGMGSPREYEVAKDTAEVTVRPAPCPDIAIPDSDAWRSGCADLTISAQRVAPGGTIIVSTTWSGNGGVCGTSATLWCAGSIDATGAFESGPFDITPPSVGTLGTTDRIDSTYAGKGVTITKDNKGPVTFTINPNISRGCIGENDILGHKDYHGPAVIIFVGGSFSWESGRMFVISPD